MASFSPSPQPTARTPANTVLCAVGDVHGRLDLLEAAIAMIRRFDGEAQKAGKSLIAVFLGDYIDRGPESRGVIKRLAKLKAEPGRTRYIFLRGNHEQVLLDLLNGVETTARWLEFGGKETVKSYGGNSDTVGDENDGAGLSMLVRNIIPPEDIDFLSKTELYVKFGGYLFVHAGLKPDRLLEEQSSADMLWFRYYSDETPIHGEMVVHGHSPNDTPIEGRWRLGIDTGAYESGALTLLRLEDEKRAFYKVHRPSPTAAAVAEPWTGVSAAYTKRSTPTAGGARSEGRPKRSPSPKSRRTSTAKAKSRPKAATTAPKGLRSRLGGVGLASAVGLATVAAVAGAMSMRLPANLSQAGEAARPPPPSAALRAPPPPPAQAPPASTAPDASAPSAPAPADQAGSPSAPVMAAIALQTTAAATQTQAATSVQAPRSPTAIQPVAAAAAGAPQRADNRVSVQIGAVPTDAIAKGLWQAVAGRYPDQIAGKSFSTQTITHDGSTLYRALITGFASYADAKRFCSTLAAGSQPCIARRGAQSESE